VERECELKSNDEEKSVVKFTRHNLLNDEIRHHVAQGKLPVKLALSWDGRVGFVLTEALQLKKISFLEGVFDGTSAGKEDGFDADVAIATGELGKLIPDLFDALGGEMPLSGGAPTDQVSPSAPSPMRTPAALSCSFQKLSPMALGNHASHSASVQPISRSNRSA
jgi:recombination associated protein RdgC